MRAGCKVKICGITSQLDGWLAAENGADYLGVVVEVPFSPRSLTREQAKKIVFSSPLPLAVLVYQPDFPCLESLVQELNPQIIQFLSPAGDLILRCKKMFPNLKLWQSLHLPPQGEMTDAQSLREEIKFYCDLGIDAIVFDTVKVINGEKRFGGTGRENDWLLVKQLISDCPAPAFLAGGITPANVSAAIKKVNPYGIDLCSGVEAWTGKKSVVKLAKLFKAVRREGQEE